MKYDEFDILPPSTAALDVGSEAIRLARSILRRNPGTATALGQHPKLANLSASAIVMLGGRVLKDLLSRCRSTEELRARLEAAANEQVEGCVIDVDTKL
jgi:hypothetical protein